MAPPSNRATSMPVAPPSIMPTAPNRATMAAISRVVFSQLLSIADLRRGKDFGP
jgi:hypothetical protein